MKTVETKLPDASGIYMIRSITNGKRYIGSAVNLINREAVHFCSLKRNNHRNRHLQNHYNKYDKADLQFSVIEFCSQIKLIEREQYYIDILKPEFNIRKIADSNFGIKFGTPSEEHKRKIGEGNRGKIVSKETRKKLSEVGKGRVFSEEHRRRISEVKKGWEPSEETRKKMSENRVGINNPFYGKHHSKETKRKLSESHTGMKYSEESKKKMSEVQKGENNPMFGKKHSKEAKRKIGEASKERKCTKETRYKMSIARIAYLKKKKLEIA